MKLLRSLRLCTVLLLTAVGGLAFEPMWLDPRNDSISREVETAVAKGLEYVQKHHNPAMSVDKLGLEEFVDEDLPRRPLELIVRFRTWPAPRQDKGAVRREISKIHPGRSIEETLKLISLWHELQVSFVVFPGDGAKNPEITPGVIKQMLKLEDLVCRARESSDYGALKSGGAILNLIQIARVAGVLAGVREHMDDPKPVLAKETWQYIARCQIAEGPDAGAFLLWPPGMSPQGSPQESLYLATAAGVSLASVAQVDWQQSKGISRASALRWLGLHYDEWIQQPFPVVRRVCRCFSKHEPLMLRNGTQLEVARAVTEKLINEQNGDGSWNARPGWPEQDKVKVTVDAVNFLRDLIGILQ